MYLHIDNCKKCIWFNRHKSSPISNGYELLLGDVIYHGLRVEERIASSAIS